MQASRALRTKYQRAIAATLGAPAREGGAACDESHSRSPPRKGTAAAPLSDCCCWPSLANIDQTLGRSKIPPITLVSAREGYAYDRGVFSALATIVRDEGVAALYTGVVPTMLRAGALAAAEMAVYGTAKEVRHNNG